MTTYTPVAKPTNTSYTAVNTSGGKETYDQANLTYDDSATFYDGINSLQYTDVAKPTGTSYTNIAKP